MPSIRTAITTFMVVALLVIEMGVYAQPGQPKFLKAAPTAPNG